MEINEYAPGAFCWVDLMTSDAAGAKKFYSALFGWDLEDMPMGDGGTYTFANVRGKGVAAMAQMSPDMQKGGMPPVWQSYVCVQSADDVQKNVEAAGGKVLMPALDVLDVGRMCVMQDPTGAIVSAWQPKKHKGAALINEPGAFCWNELLTRDTDAAQKFYTRVFGWKPETTPMPSGAYTMFKVGERGIGGMMKMPEQAAAAPAHWGVYFAVQDCDASVKKAKELGAAVHVPPTDIPGVGRFALLQDPQGAFFNVIKLTM